MGVTAIEVVCRCGVRVKKSGATAGQTVRCMACGSDVPLPAPAVARDDLQVSYQAAKDSLSAQPRNPDLLVQLGSAAEAIGSREEAFLYYERAFGLDPSRAELVERLRANAVTKEQRKKVTSISSRAPSFTASLRGVLAYPFGSPRSVTVMIMGGLLFFGIQMMVSLSAFPWAAFTAAGILLAYLSSFFIDVLNATANGDDDVPDWPDFTDPLGISWDLMKFSWAYMFAFLPIVLLIGALIFYVLCSIMDVAGETRPFMKGDGGPVQVNTVRFQDS